MKAIRFAGLRPIHRYTPGDLLLEFERITTTGPVVLNVFGSPTTTEPPATKILDIIKPKSDDFPALTKTLQVLKLNPDEVAEYHQILGSIINVAAGCVWSVGAVLTVANVLKELFGDARDETLLRLEIISHRIESIYGYLGKADKKGLLVQAVVMRGKLKAVHNAVNNARISRSPSTLNELVKLKAELDEELHLMLDPINGEISFQRLTYGYTHASHWIDACTPPYMTLADGTPLNYRDPAAELGSTIWDAGHYIDVLLKGIMDRLQLVATTEPAFRSTFYDREQLENMVTGLTAFIEKWRASLIIADPVVGLNGGGPLFHPMVDAPSGIVIGAVDPVTGIAFFDPYWGEFTLLSVWYGIPFAPHHTPNVIAKGQPDETRAINPTEALARARDLQPRLLDGVVRASGIGRLVELRARLQDILARPTVGSDFVDLSNASFSHLGMRGPEAESVDLGLIGKYGKHPNKKYDGDRYTQTFEKRFRFAMAVRTDVSLIQLGYRIEIGSRSIPLIPYSVAPGSGTVSRFPTQPISIEIRKDDWTVYDVYQSTIFSAADEDAFEGGDAQLPSPKFDPSRIVPQPKFETSRIVPVQRLFLNERTGSVGFNVQISFDADLDSPEQPFVGHATVTIRNIEPEPNEVRDGETVEGRYRGGVILPVTVFETRVVSKNGQRQEFVADRMTVHLVPSFLVLGNNYFLDRREASENMNTIFGGINDRYAISEQPLVPVGPEWQVRRRAVEEAVKIRAIEQFEQAEPLVAEQVLQRFQLPRLR